MGIRFNCPNGHKLNVKEFLAGKRGVCPQCGAKFVIPIPSELAPAEAPLSVGSGLSQSVEIAVAPTLSHPAISDSPSVILPVTEVELGSPELELPPAIREPIPAADALPTSIVAVQTPTAASPAESSPEAVIASKRERGRRNQVVISLLLLGLVILLAGILVWVLKREATKTPVEESTAVDVTDFKQHFTIASLDSRLSSYSRAEAQDP